MKKHIFALTIVLLLLVTSIAFAMFDDASKHWAADDINALVQSGAVNGYSDGTFRPDNTITRGEFTKILVVLKADAVTAATGHWAQRYVNTAVDKGYLPYKHFDDLDKPISRQEMAYMIAKAADNPTPYPYAFSLSLKDFTSMDPFYQETSYTAYGSGIIGGYKDNTFRPTNFATRAEAATMLMRMHREENRQPRTVSFNEQTLSYYDGTDGKPALIAVSGKVYDVSAIGSWKDGVHRDGIKAGKDLTDYMQGSPHSPAIVDELELVGVFTK